jgi:hypothetical protein
MDWSSYPLVTAEDSQADAEQDESSARVGMLTPVDFQDLRFDYDIFGRGEGRHALGAEVILGPDGSVVQMKMGDRVER